MKTTLPLTKITMKTVCVIAILVITLSANAQSGTGGGSNNLSNGLKFENAQLIGGDDLQLGAEYLFSSVNDTTDAIVKIVSLVNGAKVNKIDDNSNGTGYKSAFQPAVQSGGVIGYSYAVFSFHFFKKNTNTPSTLQFVNATALDLDGNNTLKEFARVNIGNGGTMAYMSTTTDISLQQISAGNFMGENILGIERAGIDTATLNNMYTASNSDVSSFTIAYGAKTSNPSSSVRQFSLYLKGFYYPSSTLPVKLISFTASLNNSKVDLKWTTTSEINVSHFVVERSTDGSNYSEAGLVFAYGNASEKANYSLSDNISNIQNSVVYYRLRSVDADGKEQLSETRIIRINYQGENTISILTYPNPVSNELRITIPSNWQDRKAVYEVLNINGQVAKRAETANSSQTETINVSSLAPGFYIVRVSCEGQIAQQKIIKH